MENKQSDIIHLVDFDGTLTTGDSLLHFLQFAAGPMDWIRAALSVPLRFAVLLAKEGWSNSRAKELLISLFFKGKTRDEMIRIGEAFSRAVLPGLLRQSLLNTLRDARVRGEQVVVVSASLDVWLSPFCASEGFELLCTELEYKKTEAADGGLPLFTGRFATPNCNRAEKARRINAAYRLKDFDRIFAYGNSEGDAAMFALAHEVVQY